MDIDTDSQGSKREQVIEALKNYFGHDKVLNVATFGTEKTKKALSTAARGLGISDDVSTYLNGLIVNNRGFDMSIHDTYYGNEEDGIKPNKAFVDEIDKYENYLETALSLEGTISSLGSHASALYLFNEAYYEINAMMKTPNGLEITQWDYRDSDSMGALKQDILSIEGLDKMRSTMDLLIKDDVIQWQGSLKETYNKYLHPDVLDYSAEMWEPAWRGEVLDLFQFQTEQGGKAIQEGKPTTVSQAADLNSLMRLMAQDGGELPINKFIRFKDNIQLWYDELNKYNVPINECELLEKHYLPSMGVPNTQEQLMEILLDEKICGLPMKDVQGIRKIIGKKLMDKIPSVKKQIFESAKVSKETIQYIWDTAISVQMGYSFSILHTTAYTVNALQELNLYNKYPHVYWNTGCLIVNSGDLEGSSTDYSKIAVAIGNVMNNGIKVNLVDINKSEILFSPNAAENFISYGFRSLAGVGYDFIQTILAHRPFTSLLDFLEKTQPNKAQATSLIKAGAFQKIDNENRVITMLKYAKYLTTKRKNLSITQVPLLVEANLLDVENKFKDSYRVYEFNRYVKNELRKTENKDILLDERGIGFLDSMGLESFYEYKEFERGMDYIMSSSKWSKYYDKSMNPIRDYLKANKKELLESVRVYEMVQMFEDIGEGTIPKWEMDSMSFYYTEHELAHVNYEEYNIVPFQSLPREAEKEANGKWFRNKTNSIIGTIISKNKTKGNLSILTPEGDVVLVSIYKNKFSAYDRQISERDSSGKKKVIEKSWFTRGNKIFLHGFRRGDQFVPRTYNNSPYPDIALITESREDGTFSIKVERETV